MRPGPLNRQRRVKEDRGRSHSRTELGYKGEDKKTVIEKEVTERKDKEKKPPHPFPVSLTSTPFSTGQDEETVREGSEKREYGSTNIKYEVCGNSKIRSNLW